ncbi:MAG TPA: iron ABC transporter permease [Jiangellaceae bacterium]|nr:iron ABC transporter permease [Jiangellaceae bacterium]
MTTSEATSAGATARTDAAEPDASAAPPGRRRRVVLFTVAVGTLVLALGAGVMIGAAGLTVRSVGLELLNAVPGLQVESGLSTQEQAILWQIRMPRVVLGALVGGMLAIAGATYQAVFRNPLADPYLLGVSSGAGLGATVVIVAGGTIGMFGVPAAAFVGALAGVALTYAIGSSVGGGQSTTVIILAGVAVAAFAGAIQTFIQQRFTESLVEVTSWLLGRLSTDGWADVVIALPYAVVACAVIMLHRRVLDVMAVGDLEASSLGVNPGRIRLVLVIAATLGTAAVVSVSGLIGFVGIVVPHAIRLVVGSSNRVLLPAAMLFGAAFLVLADIVARSAMAPAEMPIGVVTAFIGAPFFMVVLRRNRGSS